MIPTKALWDNAELLCLWTIKTRRNLNQICDSIWLNVDRNYGSCEVSHCNGISWIFLYIFYLSNWQKTEITVWFFLMQCKLLHTLSHESHWLPILYLSLIVLLSLYLSHTPFTLLAHTYSKRKAQLIHLTSIAHWITYVQLNITHTPRGHRNASQRQFESQSPSLNCRFLQAWLSCDIQWRQITLQLPRDDGDNDDDADNDGDEDDDDTH